MICTDLWPAIISYCTIEDYCRLSLASCLFDPLLKDCVYDIVDGPLIFERNGTDIFYRFCCGQDIIKTDSGKLLIIDRRFGFLSAFTVSKTMTLNNRGMRIIYTVNEITNDLIKNYEWSLQTGYLLIAYNDDTIVIMRPTETTFTRNKMLRVSLGMFTKDLDICDKLSFGGLEKYNCGIDQENKVISISSFGIRLEGYRTIYSNGRWTR